MAGTSVGTRVEATGAVAAGGAGGRLVGTDIAGAAHPTKTTKRLNVASIRFFISFPL